MNEEEKKRNIESRIEEDAELKEGRLQFFRSFDLENEVERNKAEKIYNFIIRQVNNESLMGFLNDAEYMQVVYESTKALYKLIYIQLSDFDEMINKGDYEYSKEINKCDIIYTSSKLFLWLLFTRIHNGRHIEIIKEEIASRKPIIQQKT